MSGLEVLAAAARARIRSTELPVIMVTARTRGRRHRRSVPARRQRLRHQADRLSRSRSRASRTHLAHKRAVEDLRESEERYALARAAAPTTASGTGTSSTNEVYWSPRWKAMLGYDETEMGASPEEWFTRVHPDDVARVRTALAAHLATAAATTRASTGCCTATARSAGCCCRGAAVRNGDGHGDAAGRIADRHHRREGRRRADRAAEPAAVRRSARPRDQAHAAAPGLRCSRCSCSASTASRRSATAWVR